MLTKEGDSSMSDCAIQKSRFETLTPLALEAAFDGGRLTSDGGLTWLAEADQELSLCETMRDDRSACPRVARYFREALARYAG